MTQVITQGAVDEVTEILYEMYGTGSDTSFRDDYSGRGMYGKVCVGFVVATNGVLSVGAALAQALEEDYPTLLHYMITHSCMDNMGHDWIVYFPGVTLAEDEEDEEDK